MLKINCIKPYNLKNSYVYKPVEVKKQVITELKPLSTAFITLKNNIVMKKDNNLCHYTFYENGKNIGYAVFQESEIKETSLGLAPYDWFEQTVIPQKENLFPLKPHIYINELVINDRVGLEGDYCQRKNGKKYGTMCLQKILEYAEKNGFGSRISLTPGKTHSDIEPNKFYAKLGFEMSPNDIKRVEELEAKYNAEPTYINRRKYEKIEDRWVAKSQVLFLTHPEILKNYPLK